MTTRTDLHGRSLQGGKYQLIELIAQGGMASVWSADMRSLDTVVAVKILAPALAEEPTFREQFQGEAHRIAQLHHPNIIEVHDCEAEDELLYIAMRYVRGGSLIGYMRNLDGPMDLALAAKLTAQLASALQEAHDRGLIHQDVKPANVLLGRADWPLLSDFGIAGAGTREERGGHITGTPPYMSPEQWRGETLTGASDQYSLAVLFYQLVTRELPFHAETLTGLQQQVLIQPPRRMRELNPGVPGPVEEVVLRALAKRPSERFNSTTDFSTALVESVERSRGMRLDTKQAVVEVGAGLTAVVGLSILSPALVSMANPNEPVFNELTLNWPILVLVALVQAVVLFSIRWQLVGLLGRAFGWALDGLDRVTRLYARLGTDPHGPLNVQRWRNSVVGSAEYIVNIVYVLLLYSLIGIPLVKTVSLTWDFTAEPLVATAVAALVLVLIAGNLLAMWRVSGPVMATITLALCWVFVGNLPIIDRSGFDGISLQWAAKLVIGIAVVVALLSLRKRVQQTVGTVIGPLLERALPRSRLAPAVALPAAGEPPLETSFAAAQAPGKRLEVGSATPHAAGAALEGTSATHTPGASDGVGRRWSDALVNLVYLLVAFPILAVPLRNLLEPIIGPTPAAIVITALGLLLVLLMVDVLRRAQGFALAIVGLFICAPMLLGLPLWESDAVGAGLQWVVRLLIGLAIFGLLVGLRGRAQHAARVLLVPVLGRQISAFYAPANEDAAEARLHLLGLVSDGLIDLLYVLCAYVAIVTPLVGALSSSGLSWLTTLVYLAFIAIAAWLLYRVWRHALAAGLGHEATALENQTA
jgi:tRNA A-37 threonylcarbamoyl transferase component Bud32